MRRVCTREVRISLPGGSRAARQDDEDDHHPGRRDRARRAPDRARPGRDGRGDEDRRARGEPGERERGRLGEPAVEGRALDGAAGAQLERAVCELGDQQQRRAVSWACGALRLDG
jgi:hypothetical protein